jgi:hypothetical protein
MTLEKLMSRRPSKEAIRAQISSENHQKRMDGRTSQDLLQHADIETMGFHDMEESDFSSRMIWDSRGQQCSKSVRGMYCYFVIVVLSLGCHCSVQEMIE